jgi:hypothetical protein
MTCGLLMPILGGIAWAWIGGLLPSPFLVLAAAILAFLVFLITWALREAKKGMGSVEPIHPRITE